MRALTTLLVVSLVGSVFAQPQYSVQVIGTYGPNNLVWGNGVNDFGTVTGARQLSPTSLEAVIWQNGQVGSLPGYQLGGGNSGRGINNQGHIVGTIRNEFNRQASGLLRDGQWLDIGYPGSLPLSAVTAINDHDWIIGHGYNPDDILPYVWKNGEMEYLGDVWPNLYHSYPTAINNNGWIVGYSHDQEYGRYGGWLWKPETGMARFNLASDVNDHNQILAGDYDNLGVKTTTIIDPDGTVHHLGIFDGEFLNNRGEVAGDKYLWGDDDTAAIFTGGHLYRLDDLVPASNGMTFEGVKGLNNRGQILTTARPFGEDWTVDVLLTPVPEPTAFIGMGLGLSCLIWRSRRTKGSQCN